MVGRRLSVTRRLLVATVDDDRRELEGGWVAITDGIVQAVGASADPAPDAERVLDASGCLVTPGLINTHHHIYQNLTRSFRPAVNGTLFQWLTTLYPRWAALDEEAAYVSAWIGLAELALGGCTTSTDHLYVHPRGGGDLITAEIRAAQELGMRFHPTRGSMSLSEKDGGLPPDSVVQDDDEILADSERLVAQHHDPSWGAMVRIALAPCSPFSVTPELMRATAELAERLDVRLHTHLAEDPDEDRFAEETFGRRTIEQFEEVGWGSDRAWVAHCIYPNDDGDRAARQVGHRRRALPELEHADRRRRHRAGGRVARRRRAGRPRLRRLGVDRLRVALDGSAQRAAARPPAQGPHLDGRATRSRSRRGARPRASAATGELGQLSVGAVGDLVCWPLEGIPFAGALTDPIEAWLRCGPVAARHTVVNGSIVVEDGGLVAPGEEDMLRRHREISARIQGVSSKPW